MFNVLNLLGIFKSVVEFVSDKAFSYKVIFSDGETDYPEEIEARNDEHLYMMLEGYEQDIVSITVTEELKDQTND